MSKETLEIIKGALGDLSEYYGNNGCNDLLIPDCEENRRNVLEYQKYVGEEIELFVKDGQILTWDGLGVYLIKKALNLL
jgi:hypothetical protein